MFPAQRLPDDRDKTDDIAGNNTDGDEIGLERFLRGPPLYGSLVDYFDGLYSRVLRAAGGGIGLYALPRLE